MEDAKPTTPTDSTEAGGPPLLEVRNLKTYFFSRDSIAKAVDGVSFSIRKGQTLGIVGESGCGKSVTSLSILRLVPDPPGRIVDGDILLRGKSLLELPESEMRKIRGSTISMIFQEPMTSLNPVFTVGAQIAEVFRIHQGMSKKAAFKEAVRMLDTVKIPLPEQRAKEYPHQLSGGMRQRVMIAMALACNPAMLIADEPTTALDVTVQAQILKLMRELQAEYQSAIMMITHDLAVIAETADRVAIMYAGQIVEDSDVRSLFKTPLHPYTKGLMASVPDLSTVAAESERLIPVAGNVPDPSAHPQGCRFHPRCPYAADRCKTEDPELESSGIEGHEVRCHFWKEIEAGTQPEHEPWAVTEDRIVHSA